MLKRTKLKRIGKIGKINLEANRRLKAMWIDRGIAQCEVGLPDCWRTNGLTNAHRHKRDWYKGDVDKLSDYNQVVLCCISCHQKIEYDKKLTDDIFKRLRNDED